MMIAKTMPTSVPRTKAIAVMEFLATGKYPRTSADCVEKYRKEPTARMMSAKIMIAAPRGFANLDKLIPLFSTLPDAVRVNSWTSATPALAHARLVRT